MAEARLVVCFERGVERAALALVAPQHGVHERRRVAMADQRGAASTVADTAACSGILILELQQPYPEQRARARAARASTAS